MIQQPLDDLVPHYGLFDNFFAVLGLDLNVLDDLVTLLNTDQGAQFAEALAAGLLNANSVLFVMAAARRKYQFYAGGLFYQIFKDLMDLIGTGGNTAGAGANQDPAIIGIQLCNSSFSCLREFIHIVNH